MKTDRIDDRVVNNFTEQSTELELIPKRGGLTLTLSNQGKNTYWSEVLVHWHDVDVLINQLQELKAHHGKDSR